MSRILALFMVLVLLSCQGPSNHQSQTSGTSDTIKTIITRDDQEMSCEGLLSAIVKSSNAVALKHLTPNLSDYD